MIPARFALLLIALLLGSGVYSEVLSQAVEPSADPGLAELTVDIWPEFDDPRVLVIYDGMLAAGVDTPREFSFIVPADAKVHMAGGIAPDGSHVHADFDTRLRADGLMEVSYTLQVPRVYMEFYYDPFTSGDQRRFTYPVVSDLEIDSLMVRVQEPFRAVEFELEPAATDAVQDTRGLSYGLVHFTGVPAETVTPVMVSYRKADRQPSVARPTAPSSSQGAGPREPAPFPWGRVRSWVLGTLAAMFFAVGLYKLSVTTGSRGAHGAGTAARAGSAPGLRFCSECGQPVESSHKYCGECGRPLRGSPTA